MKRLLPAALHIDEQKESGLLSDFCQGYKAPVLTDLLLWTFPVFAYLLGSFPSGVVFSRRYFGIDVREMGSGNTGATNVTRNFGWKAGALVLALDFFKAYLPVFGLLFYLPPGSPNREEWVAATGVAVVVGHCFSVFLKFTGGKGVASAWGVFTATVPKVALVAALTYFMGMAVTRISAVGSLMAITVAVFFGGLYVENLAYRVMVWAICAIVLFRHRVNIGRLRQDIALDSKKKNR